MSDIAFDATGIASFPTKHHGDVTLSKRKWNEICAEPERDYYRHNGEKVSTTLITPDRVRHHKCVASQFIYYKQFDSFQITEGVDVQWAVPFMAVVIDQATGRICTLYPTDKLKPGVEYKPKGT